MTALLGLFVSAVMAASPVTCENLQVTGGNNRFAPSTVSFLARASESVPSYTFYFGDGQKESSASPQANHRYDVSGTYTARAYMGSSSCQVIFSLLTNPLESQKSGCSDVFIEGGNTAPTGANVKFLVTGFENKSGIKKYKIDFGNGQVKESNTGNFDLTYPSPGTFTIKGYITDSKNAEKGGLGSCQTQLYVTGAPLTTQPATGTPTWFTLAGILSGLGLLLVL